MFPVPYRITTSLNFHTAQVVYYSYSVSPFYVGCGPSINLTHESWFIFNNYCSVTVSYHIPICIWHYDQGSESVSDKNPKTTNERMRNDLHTICDFSSATRL